MHKYPAFRLQQASCFIVYLKFFSKFYRRNSIARSKYQEQSIEQNIQRQTVMLKDRVGKQSVIMTAVSTTITILIRHHIMLCTSAFFTNESIGPFHINEEVTAS